RCSEVSRFLFIVPGRFELLHEVAGGDDFDAERVDQLNGTGIDAANVRVAIAWRVFHRDALDARKELADTGFQLLPAAVDDLLRARQGIQRRRLDCVRELPRLTGRGDEVEPAAGELLLVQPDDALGEYIAAPEVI